MNHVREGWGGGVGLNVFCVEDTGRVKIILGDCSLKDTRPDGECSKILVSNPVKVYSVCHNYGTTIDKIMF